jgi:hypothetical protein
MGALDFSIVFEKSKFPESSVKHDAIPLGIKVKPTFSYGR